MELLRKVVVPGIRMSLKLHQVRDYRGRYVQFFLFLCICSFKNKQVEGGGEEEENRRACDRDGQLKMREYLMSCPLVYYSSFGRWYRGKGNAAYAQNLKIASNIDQRTCQAVFHIHLEIIPLWTASDIFPSSSPPHIHWLKRLSCYSKLHSPLLQRDLFFFVLWSIVIADTLAFTTHWSHW